MSMLNIRIDESTKMALQEVAHFKGETLSSLALNAINKMLEDEFDIRLAQEVLTQRKTDEKNYPIDELFAQYGL